MPEIGQRRLSAGRVEATYAYPPAQPMLMIRCMQAPTNAYAGLVKATLPNAVDAMNCHIPKMLEFVGLSITNHKKASIETAPEMPATTACTRTRRHGTGGLETMPVLSPRRSPGLGESSR